LSGFAVYVKLLQKIYSEGYFYYLGQDELLLTSKRINVDINSLNVIINCCIKRNLFNDVLFDKYNILTSQGIQKRFIEATLRRKEVEIIDQYWLGVDYDFNRVKIIDVDINPDNVDIKKQSKVKESKVKERKELSCDDFEQVWILYGKKGNKKTSTAKWSKLKEETKQLALLKIPAYVKSTPDIQYRKNFETWLNQECWNDEIPVKQTGLFGNNCAEQKSELIEAIARRKREDEEKAETQIDDDDSLPF
jgi:hypothetical protein